MAMPTLLGSGTNLLIKLGLACHYKKNENDQYVDGREIYARSGLDS